MTTSLNKVDARLIVEPMMVLEPPCNAMSLAETFWMETIKEKRSCVVDKNDGFSLWHHGLGHAP